MVNALIVALTVVTPFVPQAGVCTPAPSAPALDHVVLVVRDLDTAAARFSTHGFTLKPGRLHPNNLLNRHVKFRDGTGLELMTVQGKPGDAMAQRYVDLLAAGEGGVYVALTARDLALPRRAAERQGLATRESASGTWQFLGFPADSPAAALFFSSGVPPVNDPAVLVTHEPDAAGLSEAWVEGDARLGEYLAAAGAARCGPARSPDGVTGDRWALGRGYIAIVAARAGVRPRVLGVVLRGKGPNVVRPHAAFWVAYSDGAGGRD